jgi:hypothetical protein
LVCKWRASRGLYPAARYFQVEVDTISMSAIVTAGRSRVFELSHRQSGFQRPAGFQAGRDAGI